MTKSLLSHVAELEWLFLGITVNEGAGEINPIGSEGVSHQKGNPGLAS